MNKKSKFIFDAAVDSSIRVMLLPLKNLIPSWCNIVTVSYTDDERVPEYALAAAESQYEYRAAHLIFYPRFFEATKEQQLSICRHELIHITTNIVYDYVNKAFDRLTAPENAELIDSIREELTARVESVTQDLVGILQETK